MRELEAHRRAYARLMRLAYLLPPQEATTLKAMILLAYYEYRNEQKEK